VVKAVLFALALTLSGCTLFDDGPPKNTCTTDTDCFRAQGEHCDQQKHECVAPADAGVDAR
jgi:hypothetical protein